MTQLSNACPGIVPRTAQHFTRLALFLIGLGTGAAQAEVNVDYLTLRAVVTAATRLVAAAAHAFCSIVCIHGDQMIDTEICAGRG